MSPVRVSVLFVMSAALAACQSGNRDATECKRDQLTFEPPLFAAGTQWTAPTGIYNNHTGLAASVGSFTPAKGAAGTFGAASIDAGPPHPFGSGQVIRMNNTALTLDLCVGTTAAVFEYLDMGGSVNLSAHGGPDTYIGPMRQMPSRFVLNGIDVERGNVVPVTNAGGQVVGETGVITLTHGVDIGGMRVGGQELWLDTFRFR